MQITLPKNAFGYAIMLTLILLIAVIPFVLTVWLFRGLAPWWCYLPMAIAASLLSLLFTVKRRS